MLVLSRKVGQHVLVGDNIVVKVLRIKRGSVRLGIHAPQIVKVLRNEVLEKDKKARDKSLIIEKSGS